MALETETSSSSQNSPEPRGLLYILLSVFGVLFFWSSRRLQGAKKHESTIHNSEETDRRNSHCPHEVHIRAELHTPDHIETQTTKYNKSNNTLQKWLVWGTWLTFFAAALYAGISLKIWAEMQEQTRIQRQTGINTERAWLGLDGSVEIDKLTLGSPQSIVMSHYRITNFGHGPAFKVVPNGWFVTDEKRLESVATVTCKLAETFTTGTASDKPSGTKKMIPRGSVLFTSQWIEDSIGSEGDPYGFERPPDLKKIWFVGCVAYLDQFKTPHWSRFCVTSPNFGIIQPISKDTPLQPCPLYNDTDDSEHGEDQQKRSNPVTAPPK